MYDLKPSQFVKWNRSLNLFTFMWFDKIINIYKSHVMICDTRVYFYVIYKSRVWWWEIIQDIFAFCGFTYHLYYAKVIK